MITRFDLLDIVPTQDFFPTEQFCSRLKGGLISEEEHTAVKNLYLTLKMENLGELNKLYNFQDTIILCESFESWATHLNKIFKFDPWKFNSASPFSGCVHREKSKCFTALSINTKQVKLFERTLIGGFSGVNTRLIFDSQILLLGNQRDDLELIYKIKTSKGTKNKIISDNILKMDENNQYGNAMTKPLLYGCIKRQQKIPSLREINAILNSHSYAYKIGHLFIADIKFHV